MAVLTASITDSAGHSDAGRTRTVNARFLDSAGHADGDARLAVLASGTDPAGLSDTATPGTAPASVLTRTITDSAGHADPGQEQLTAELREITDSAGASDTAVAVLTPSEPADPGAMPTLIVQMSIGGRATVDPAAGGAFVLGRSRLGSGRLGAATWVDVSADVVSLSTTPSPAGVTDSASPGTVTIVLDNFAGLYDPDSAVSYDLDVGQQVRIRAQWAGTTYSLAYAHVDEIVPDYGWNPTVTFVCTDGLAQLGRARVREIVPSFDGDRTDQRIGRILDEADWPASLRQLDRGLVTCQADTYGDNALPLAQRVVDTELGEHFVDGAGRYIFFNRTHVHTSSRSTTVQAVFSDSGDDIDMEGAAASRRRGDLFNQAAITRNGDGTVEQFHEDATSRAKYGPQTFPRQAGTLLRTDAEALSLVRWIVTRFRQPGTRMADIVVDATAQGMWTQLLGLQRFDRIRVQRTYGTAAVLVDREVLVEGIAWSIAPAGPWTATISTRSAGDAFQPFVLGTSRLGTGRLV